MKEDLKLSQVFEDFIWRCQVNGLRDRTIENYNVMVKQFFIDEFMKDAYVSALQRKDVERYVVYLRQRKKRDGNTISDVTVKSYYTHVKAFINFMYQSRITEVDLIREPIKIRPYRTKIDIYYDEELSFIFQNIKGQSLTAWRVRLLFATYLLSGCRAAEVLTIKLSDVDEAKGYVKIKDMKTYHDKYMPICIAYKRILQKYIDKRLTDGNDYLFTNNKGKPLDYASIRRYQQTYINKRASITRGNVKLFRHTYVTRSLFQGVPVRMIMDRTGHQTMKTLEGYTRDVSRLQYDGIQFEPMDKLLMQLIKDL